MTTEIQLTLFLVFSCTFFYLISLSFVSLYHFQWRSQNAEKVTHIRGKLLNQAVILFNCVRFQNGNFSLRKEFDPSESELFPFRAVPYGMDNHFYHIR